MEDKKFLILCNNISVGGITKSLISLLKALYNSGIEIDVASLQVSNNKIKNQIIQFANYIEISELNTIAKMPKGLKKLCFLAQRHVLFETLMLHFWSTKKENGNDLAKRKWMFFNSKREYKICKNSKATINLSNYDCVISWSELMTNYILAENIVCNKKIGWVHPDYINGGFSSDVDIKAFKKLDAVVAVSQNGKESLKKVFPDMTEKIFFVGNLLDLNEIRALSTDHAMEMTSNYFKIVTVARLQNFSKAFDRAVRICKKLKDSGRKFMWYIIGDGENKNDIQNDIDRFEVNDCVILLGNKNNPYPYMKNADLFVLQSYYEGRPVSVDEAMVIGTPVLVTDYASATEQVQNGFNGFVVPNQEEGIFEKIAMIIDNPSMLINIRDNLSKNSFSQLTEISNFEKLILSVVSK